MPEPIEMATKDTAPYESSVPLIPEPTIHEKLDILAARLEAQGEKLDAVTSGVNTIGGMMNEVAEAFGKILETVQKGGIGALMGMMGGKKNGD